MPPSPLSPVAVLPTRLESDPHGIEFALVPLSWTSLDKLLGMSGPARRTTGVPLPSPCPVALLGDEVFLGCTDVLVLASFAHLPHSSDYRFTTPGPGLHFCPEPIDQVTVTVNDDGVFWSVLPAGWARAYQTPTLTTGRLLFAALSVCPEARIPSLFHDLAEVDPVRALDTLERGVALYRIGAIRTLPRPLPADALLPLLTAADPAVRLRAAQLVPAYRAP